VGQGSLLWLSFLKTLLKSISIEKLLYLMVIKLEKVLMKDWLFLKKIGLKTSGNILLR